MATSADARRLEDAIRGRICVRCQSRPEVPYRNQEFVIACHCPEGPSLGPPGSEIEDRRGRMVAHAMEQQGQDTGTALARRDRADVAAAAPPPMTVQEFHDRQALIKAVVGEMQDGVHYGLIPGTHDKSLWEPGAEYLRAAFRIDWTFVPVETYENHETHEYRYKIIAQAIYPDGTVYAQWPASAWSKERRFWCRSSCPKPCDQNHPPSMEAEMMPHNVEDRAVKRGFVALMRNVTGTTGYFKMALDVDSNGSPPRQATASVVGDAPVGIRRTCPTHGEDWHPEKKPGWGGFHPVPGGPICSLKTLLTELISQAATEAGKTTADINAWVKKQAQYKANNLSSLTVEDKCDVYERVKGITVQAPTTETEAPVAAPASNGPPMEDEQGPPPREEMADGPESGPAAVDIETDAQGAQRQSDMRM